MARPSTYDPKYCDLLIAHMRQGFSFESFGGDLGVHKDTLFDWCNKHEDFMEAKRIGQTLSLKFWEELGMKGMMGLPIEIQLKDKQGNIKTITGKTFNPTIYNFTMKNKHRWMDRTDVTSAGEKVQGMLLNTIPPEALKTDEANEPIANNTDVNTETTDTVE